MAYFDTVSFSNAVRALILAGLLSPVLSGCSVTYEFAPIEAWVVDAETGKPIEGAVVTANWELVKGSLDGPRYFGQLEVKETVTDANGRFFFEGFSKEDSSGAELRESDPQILIFKAGYKFERFVNDYPVDWRLLIKSERTAAVNGQRVELKRMGDNKDLIRQRHSELVYSRLGFVTKVMPHTHESEKCYWQRIPQMLRETHLQEIQMRSLGIDPPSLYARLLANSDQYAARAKVPCVAASDLLGKQK